MEAQQCVELTGTNRPRTCLTQHTSSITCVSRVHCAVLKEPNTPPPNHHHSNGVWVGWLGNFHRVTAVMARGKRPVSFRTRKLSLSAPMVLPGGPGGRVGHRRTPFTNGVTAHRCAPRSPGVAGHSYGGPFRALPDRVSGAVPAERWTPPRCRPATGFSGTSARHVVRTGRAPRGCPASPPASSAGRRGSSGDATGRPAGGRVRSPGGSGSAGAVQVQTRRRRSSGHALQPRACTSSSTARR